MYGIYGRLFGGNHIGVEYDDSINFNLYKLIDNIDEYTRLVVISNPFIINFLLLFFFVLCH